MKSLYKFRTACFASVLGSIFYTPLETKAEIADTTSIIGIIEAAAEDYRDQCYDTGLTQMLDDMFLNNADKAGKVTTVDCVSKLWNQAMTQVNELIAAHSIADAEFRIIQSAIESNQPQLITGGIPTTSIYKSTAVFDQTYQGDNSEASLDTVKGFKTIEIE